MNDGGSGGDGTSPPALLLRHGITQRRVVLITRPLAGADRTADLIQQRGYDPLIAPILRIRTLTPDLPRKVQAVLVTSGNAVDGVAAWPVPIFAVGDATAARARAAGFTDVRSASGDATALVARASQDLDPRGAPLLLLSGARQGQAAAGLLRKAGFRVLRRVTYAASAVSRFPPQAAVALGENTMHAAIFLSAETASAFVRLFPSSAIHQVQGVLGLAIGNAAADALKPLPWRRILIASTPNLDGVLALL